MKKICTLSLCAFLSSLLLCACDISQSSSILKPERRFAKYLPGASTTSTQDKSSGVVDLSEGPKLKYDANFGPKNPEFDFKIVNPY